MRLQEIQLLLDTEVQQRNHCDELSSERPDPLMVARKYPEEHFALTCAVFAYGNARSIVAFLSSLGMELIDADEATLRNALQGHYYRFQNSEDIIQWHITLQRLREAGGVESVFMSGYEEDGVLLGISQLIKTLYALNSYRSKGYEFLIGKPIEKLSKASAMKRWMMYLRWMVRKDELDMGLWNGVRKDELLMPLDTHTFHVAQRLGLLTRRQCDLRAAIELTETLKQFDPNDPLKYDFALYRLGQEKIR